MTGVLGALTEAWDEVRVHKSRVVLSLVGVFLAVFAMTTVTALGQIVAQTQQDTAKPDSSGLRYSTPPVFRGTVAVRVGTAAGGVTRRFELNAREQTLTVDGVGPPTMVVLGLPGSMIVLLVPALASTVRFWMPE